ncbi:ABC transporter substrate-binding protein [Cohnella endophytica]|uniref:ABC transporter substrate-binding protein n=1 Tax=Cohnella endophytica TaxID=2419778 RepID=UPI001314C018|nr:ABC transporter substrate-binding protein [Cohnella endophytica]
MNKTKNGLMKLLCIVLVVSLMAACSKNNNNNASPSASASSPAASDPAASPSESSAPDLPEVKLTFYYPVGSAPGADQQKVNDEINKYLKEKINATVDLKPLTFDEYEPKLNAVMAAGEAFDIAWSSRGWLLNYQPNIDKGAFTELTDAMIEQYAPQARANIPDKFWPDMKANDGKVYGFPIYQVSAKTKSLVVQKRFIDKYNLDVSSIHTYKDLEPFLKQIKDGDPSIIPLGMAANSWGLYTNPDDVGADGLAAVYKKNDASYTRIKEIDQYNEKLDFYKTLHQWYKAGYINEDAPIIQNINDLKAKGNVAVGLEFTSKPGGEADEKNINGGNDVVYIPLTDSYFTGIASAMHVISRTSKNPERALMLLNLLNTDKYLYNLICNGIEGTHYTKTGDNTIEPIKDSGYAPNGDWVFGDQFNAYLKPGQAPDVWERTVKLNDEAVVSAAYGFSVNEEKIKSEIANIEAAKTEYRVTLETGAVDPTTILPKFIDKLKASGIEKVDAEVDAQWDAFLKSKGLR